MSQTPIRRSLTHWQAVAGPATTWSQRPQRHTRRQRWKTRITLKRWSLVSALLVSSLVGGAGSNSLSAVHPALAQGVAAPLPHRNRSVIASASSPILPTGPTIITPTAILTVAVGTHEAIAGLTLDGQGNIIAAQSDGHIAALAPTTGQAVWTTALSSGSGMDLLCPPAQPVVGPDGAVYQATDNGALYQIDISGTATMIYQTPDGHPLTQTPKVATDGSLYVGTGEGVFLHLQPPALDSGQEATVLATITATGSLQTSGVYSGTASTGPFSFCGQATLDSSGNAYVASVDTNPLYQSPSLRWTPLSRQWK